MSKKDLHLSDLEQKYRILVENSPDGICILDRSATILYINRVLPQFRIEDIIGTNALLYISEDQREEYLELLDTLFETGEPNSIELHMVGPSRWLSRLIPLKHNGKTISAMVISTNITELRKMEEEVQKVEKLESLGLLAGGIAHDFNNILTAILGNISLAKSFLDSKEQLLTRLKEAEKASLRASELAQQLLTFSKGGAPVKKLVSVKNFIEHSAHFALSGSNIQCQFYFQEGLWSVEADEGQLSQVIQNLVINAKQAMPSGGTIRLEVRNLAVKDEGLREIHLRNREYVLISIQDQGTGISKENLSKIFDPYFTTKTKGSGLGLSVSHSIIRRHQGAITVESNPGSGSTFVIYLPALAGLQIHPEKPEMDGMVRGRGKVLVMDDEVSVLDLVEETLSHLGYEVETAKSGVEAVGRYKMALGTGNPFDLVITDLTVPGDIGGMETLRRLKEINPQVKVIVSSGYSNDPAMADFGKFGFSDCLQKPYRAFQIGQVVKKVLKA
ncbi:MAG: response regulator [Nitrospirae bacterium]|nr:response regulator [Nitrospirota bacterium]MBI3595049.1 response regulator [Nitrospirota bacterium]